MVWKSVELQLPANLRGWDFGTLEIKGPVQVKDHLNESLKHNRIKLRTNLSKTKMQASDGMWKPKNRKGERSLFLAVRQRYASTLTVEFRKSTIGPDDTTAFAVLWLKDLVDEEESTQTLTVWKGGKKNLKRAESCCDYNGLEENEQPLGHIEVNMKFWRGLSGYHKSHANKSTNTDLRNVMECLDTINDENMEDMYSDESDSDTETEDEAHRNSPSKTRTEDATGDPDEETRKKLRTHTGQSSHDGVSEDSDVESNESSGFSKIKNPISKVQDIANTAVDKIAGTSEQDNENDGSRGMRAQVKDYKDHHKQLHRKHRGIMQFRPARTMDWAGGKARRAKSKIMSDLFEHSSKDVKVETEV